MVESPPIATRRLRIIPFREEHLTPLYVSWLNDAEVVRFSEQRHQRHTMESCRRYWKSFAGTSNFFWAVMTSGQTPEHIGNMTAYVDAANKVSDIGILIGAKGMWGQGFGLEAWMGVCRFLLQEGGMRKITAGTLSVNASMLGIMRKAGMLEEGRRMRQCLWEGQEVDMVYAALFP